MQSAPAPSTVWELGVRSRFPVLRQGGQGEAVSQSGEVWGAFVGRAGFPSVGVSSALMKHTSTVATTKASG